MMPVYCKETETLARKSQAPNTKAVIELIAGSDCHTSTLSCMEMADLSPQTHLHSMEKPTQPATSTGEDQPRSYANAAKPLIIPSLVDFECEGSCINNPMEGMPSIHISSVDLEKAKGNLAYTLIMRFTRVRPKLEAIRGIINCKWGLSSPAAVGVLDSRRMLIRLMHAKDLAIASSKNHGMIEKVPYSLFNWQSSLGRKEESPVCNKWLRLPGLQPELCVRSILSLIGNSIARFVDADPETTNTMKPSHPRICVEIDVSKPLPTKVFMQIGEADGFWQGIAFEGNPTYCSFCKMHGHTTPLCRKRILAEGKSAQQITVPASRMVWHAKNGGQVGFGTSLKDQPAVGTIATRGALEQPVLAALEQPSLALEQPARAASTVQHASHSPPQLLQKETSTTVHTSNRFAFLSDSHYNKETAAPLEDDAIKATDEDGYSLVTKRRKNKSKPSVTIEQPARTRNRSSKEDLAPALDRPEQLFYNASSKSKQRQAAKNIIIGEVSDTTADEEEPPDQMLSEWEPDAPLL
nr:DUF4283 domain-containing protein [Erythronium dens-canis]